MAESKVELVRTSPFDGQKPGTSGLRKKVVEVMQPNYLNNFVQAIFNALPADEVKGCTLVVSGDGRYYNEQAMQVIVKMSAANGVSKLVVGKNHLVSTPCVSAIIRKRRAYGGIILTASHNSGGPNGDFGIKYNTSNGGPAPDSLTNTIYEHTQRINEFLIHRGIPDVDFSQIGLQSFDLGGGRTFEVEVIDPTDDYVELMSSIFDFAALRDFVSRPDFSLTYDAMCGVAGPFARRIFCGELGLPEQCLLNCTPSADFGGGHPDPNLTYAKALVQAMGLGDTPPAQDPPDFGAAADGDADRNMILGKRFFVTPSDSVAIIAANAKDSIPYFRTNGVTGVARSMPTSFALDKVAEQLGLDCYVVPTGWKYFGNLMDAGRINICGEESFGTGSDHIREKYGIWAVLAWLSILQHKNSQQPAGSPLVTVEQIVLEHWKKFGRNFYCRYDFEEVSSDSAAQLTQHLTQLVEENCKAIEGGSTPQMGDFAVSSCDNFQYTDPVDQSIAANQGFRFNFTDGSRAVLRLSGTGSVGATIRLYLEKFESDPAKQDGNSPAVLKGFADAVLQYFKIQAYTGRDAPNVIT